ncbi:TfoX/Sxy family protein [Knoellia subterranea]|uniref:RNA methyltransferase n=1 Tax=Knoellia subterranea KCTC 19937 TaxID=1385521 RepID=A0A0A0JJ83_9MICO|nr:TfoX/Sxy family protein [Knoellia subterranea]KGN36102.1 RNA methyltransferase [Knoellia subterranea KCTC 19937]
MAYDAELADRIRTLLADEPGLTEKAMFGGLGFMLDGHMAAAANSSGGLMVRADPAGPGDPLLFPMVMRGREMAGWLQNDPDVPLTDADLSRLVGIGVAFVRTMPAKS